MAKTYIIELDTGEWSIRREDFSFSKIHNFKNFDKKTPNILLAKFEFFKKEPIYLLDIRTCNEQHLKEFICFKVDYDFVGINLNTNKELKRFQGSFIDAFKFINENQGLMGYE